MTTLLGFVAAIINLPPLLSETDATAVTRRSPALMNSSKSCWVHRTTPGNSGSRGKRSPARRGAEGPSPHSASATTIPTHIYCNTTRIVRIVVPGTFLGSR